MTENKKYTSTCVGGKHCPTSDNSEVCYNHSGCKSDHKTKQNIKDINSEEIVNLYKDAVVEIHSEFILLGTEPESGEPLSGASGGTPLGAGSRTDIILEGNGFFIKKHYIVAPAHLVLLPPSLTSTVNRFPFLDPSNLSLGQIKNQMIRASRILVSVFNVNNNGHSFVYEADLIGVDGAGDIAVLCINNNKQWNRCNPCIDKCHPFFKFGSSRRSKDGEKVYLIGDYISNSINRRLFNAVGAVSDGLLSDHRYVDYSGYGLFEAVLVSAPAYAFSSGLPILNSQGKIIGMQTTDLATVYPKTIFPTTQTTSSGIINISGGVTGVSGEILSDSAGFTGGTGFFGGTATFLGTGSIDSIILNQSEGFGFVAGPSEFFMRRVIKTLIGGLCNRKHNNQLDTISDPAGTFYRYKKAYAGVAYDIFTGVMYDTTMDFTSGAAEAGFPRIRLAPNGDFLNTSSCKELIGIRVLGLAGINPDGINGVANGLFYVPGGTGGILAPTSALPLSLPASPFLGKLLPGDVITHINGVAMGDLNKQIAPSLITWRLCAGDQLEIVYRRGGNANNTFNNAFTENYDGLYTHTICLIDFPLLMDYPWYAVGHFPLLINRGFNLPPNQLNNPQVPALFDQAIFHPAF